MREWIDVKNRLPKLDTIVIIATKSNVFPAMRKRINRDEIIWTNAVWDYEPIELYTGKVLYWQPLPEHPNTRTERSDAE